MIYQPLYGDYAQGTWSLIVTDTFGPFDGGVINSFTLEVCGIRDPIDWDVDGVPNDDDNCLFILLIQINQILMEME